LMITITGARARPNTSTGSNGTSMAWPGPSSGRSTRAVNVREVMTRVSAGATSRSSCDVEVELRRAGSVGRVGRHDGWAHRARWVIRR